MNGQPIVKFSTGRTAFGFMQAHRKAHAEATRRSLPGSPMVLARVVQDGRTQAFAVFTLSEWVHAGPECVRVALYIDGGRQDAFGRVREAGAGVY